MGKAQSKRSVDITTVVKKDDVEEGTGKMEKIEDVDQLKPQINGDTHHTDNETAEKAAEEGTENEKDLSTEKEQKPQLEGGGDEVAPPSSSAEEEKKAVENGDDETLNESKTTNETSVAESSDSSKKMKKEKVKKKWSFRSISFGRKDKQKPPKKDEGAVNGECEKVPEENPEDPAATSKEQTKEEGKSDAPEAASTPSEEKPTTPAETETGKPEEKTESTPVLNGSEPAKEDNLTAQKTAEPAPAEINKTEIEPVSKQGVEEATKTEEPAKPVEETPQENGIETVATKIEVKDVKTDVTIDPSVQTESPKPNEVKADGDSDVAQNLPPPPLPCTPPPSKVMVFALSDTEKISDSEQAQIQPPFVEQTVSDKPIEKTPEPAVTESIEIVSPIVEKLSEVPATESPAPEQLSNAEKPSTEEVKSVVEETVSASDLPKVNAEPTSTNVVGGVEKQEESSTAEQKNKDEAPQKTAKDQDVQSSVVEENKVIEPVVLGKDIKVEGDINPEQIAQTIALIDEVTQTAAAISQTKLESQDIAPESESKTTETETSCNAPKPEAKSSPPTVPENTSITDIQIPPVVEPKPVDENQANVKEKQDKVEENVEKLDEKTSEIDEKVKSVEQKPITAESTDIPKTPEEMKTEVVKPTETVTEVVKPTESQTEPTERKEDKTVEATEAAVEPSQTTTESSANIEEKDETGAIPAPVTDAAKVEGHSDSSQVAATKENGIGENHDPATESIKDNLISQPEHKTAEDIKAEQTENKAEITETTPVAVAE